MEVSAKRRRCSLAKVVDALDAMPEWIGQIVAVVAHEQALLGQHVVPEKAAEGRELVAFGREMHATVFDADRS